MLVEMTHQILNLTFEHKINVLPKVDLYSHMLLTACNIFLKSNPQNLQ